MLAPSQESFEREQILRQLKERFVDIPAWQLRQSCVANNWNLELCINQLVSNGSGAAEKQLGVSRPTEEPKRTTVDLSAFSEDEQRIGGLIKSGYRILILMRGPPGVGKSHWAKKIVQAFADLDPPYYNVEDFVYGSDDYFLNSKGEYRYDVRQLTEAHDFNQRRVRENAETGLSPIIVDNTNMRLWEMLPYVQAAVRNGYILEIVEPKTPWHKSASKLAQRNRHGVPADKIRRMMDNYESGDVTTLIKMVRSCQYSSDLPQLRARPTIRQRQENLEEMAKENCNKTNVCTDEQTFEDSSWGTYDTDAPKSQRIKTKASTPPVAKAPVRNRRTKGTVKSASDRDVYSLLEKKITNVWKPYEVESRDFWGANLPKPLNENKESASVGAKSLLDLLREDTKTNQDDNSLLNTLEKYDPMDSQKQFERHSIGCPNENGTFATLRQIYPNKQKSGLWDLFQKCNGDIDWAIDILLKEDELSRLQSSSDLNNDVQSDDDFSCSCDATVVAREESVNDTTLPQTFRPFESVDFSPNAAATTKLPPQRSQRLRYARVKHSTNPALLEVKENIENCFVLSDDYYSDHLLKVRNSRNGIFPEKIQTPSAPLMESNTDGANWEAEANVQAEDDDDDEMGNNEHEEEIIDMSLGEQLVKQLLQIFRNECVLEERIPSTLPLDLKVFMPRSLAKQLYLVWMESAYNHLEEERQQMVREDEEFARLLKHPQYAEYKQSPMNLREMLDVEYARALLKQDEENQRQQNDAKARTSDLASHLTQLKLCETFPEISPETLIDILETTDNNYNETVSILRSTMELSPENEIDKQEDDETKKDSGWDEIPSSNTETSWTPEMVKDNALRQFEEARNLAAHHCQLRAECFQKAKEAIRAGNGGVGYYYSQIANMHKQKIEVYNQQAANCIMNAHKYTQNNPDHLDLHYLHLQEALSCLDLFLDRHIAALRLASRPYKYIYIITGRGKHSAGGVSVIKSRVKSRLEERCLKWNEVNPGLLKVKVFSSSRHAQHF